MAYWMVMINEHVDRQKMKASGIDAITSNIQPVDINGVVRLPKVAWKDVARPIGPVDLLVGLEVGLHPTGGDTKVGNLRLLYSEVGTWKLDGT